MDIPKVGSPEFLAELESIQAKNRKDHNKLTRREREILILHNLQRQAEVNAELEREIAKLKLIYEITPEQRAQNRQSHRFPDHMLPNKDTRSGYLTADFLTSVLKNVGNVSYMNAVLYALRFVPQLMHGLHHLYKNVLILGGERDKYIGHGCHEKLTPESCAKWHATNKLESNRDKWSKAETDELAEVLKLKSNEVELIKALHFMFAELHRYEDHKCRDPFKPEKLKDAISTAFKIGTEHDPYAFLMFMVNAIRSVNKDIMNLFTYNPNMVKSIHDDVSAVISLLNFDFVHEFFMVQRVKKEICMQCKDERVLQEDVLDFKVNGPFLQKDFIRDSCMAEVILTGISKDHCHNCHQVAEAKHLTTYPALPPVMIVRLECFDNQNKKIERAVDLPFKIDCFCNECIDKKANHKYRLVSFVSHTGETANSGQYIVYARSAENDLNPPPASPCQYQKCCQSVTKKFFRPEPAINPWYIFNGKEEVRRFAMTEIQQQLINDTKITPYVLFYVREDFIPRSK
ncbi:uncharacterized protein LOC116337052 [Contarinia nasturtii]|uniref:uncharacterized protein LOC116337052 n=1 Tax=Contarinia nasturtii TaxID=265458 RepID=UPI0012D3AFDC|nr:uncharacterized protein LOC116337052 [Contarinia nasturtii]XP_031617204.1 uncharacterized protein LOC116337052 [Contarinia nasturtii]